MKAYISVSFRKRKDLNREIAAVVQTLEENAIKAFVFVDNYYFAADQEQQMMQQAMAEIDRCDWLLAETSEKGIGIGVEAGYAKAKGKPVIYLRQQTAEHSTTISGISDARVVYSDVADLQQQLAAVIKKLRH